MGQTLPRYFKPAEAAIVAVDANNSAFSAQILNQLVSLLPLNHFLLINVMAL